MSESRDRSSDLRAGWILAAITAANYAVWLGWDQRYDVGPGGVVSGPYQPWQVICLAAGLGVLALVAGWRGRAGAAMIAIPTVMTLCFAVDAATDSETYGASLWPIGAVMVAFATLAGVATVASLAAAAAHR
ncbi:MAG: hypothetical protein AVDCRST_MAG30-303 [uncultured Solirubrobacteraceae bacterium]|uniref:Uncharacterized protein n=1 Tax=uncultured Solirubrobacteraceae bacterium TaxID=1162706 RepID=A0A6J4RNV1_9ACTN|nr:MAG: hypothetical protein AVDCRST_MAG30-303 [uncultured Solirubrobacteraceae bacterium]